MRRRLWAIVLAGLIGGTAPALAAEEWGIEHEQKARIEGKVVDILCELTGDCPANCGDGRRQLGLLNAEGRLIPVVKNFDPFAGATVDLIQFCNKPIVADGLLIEDPLMPMMVLQFKRPAPDGKWSRANWFSKAWARDNGGKAGNWFRQDARIKAIIEKDGVFGIPGLKPEE